MIVSHREKRSVAVLLVLKLAENVFLQDPQSVLLERKSGKGRPMMGLALVGLIPNASDGKTN